MLLYGNARRDMEILSNSDGYVQVPQFWCKDKQYVLDHPRLEDKTEPWGELDKSDYDFYSVELDKEDIERTLDLRRPDWKYKLCTYISIFGDGWSSAGGLWKDVSPLRQILHSNNFVDLVENGYLWVSMDHRTDEEDTPIALWYYLDFKDNMMGDYALEKMSYEEFAK